MSKSKDIKDRLRGVAVGVLVKDDVPECAIIDRVPARVLKYKWDESTRKRHRNFLNQAEYNAE